LSKHDLGTGSQSNYQTQTPLLNVAQRLSDDTKLQMLLVLRVCSLFYAAIELFRRIKLIIIIGCFHCIDIVLYYDVVQA